MTKPHIGSPELPLPCASSADGAASSGSASSRPFEDGPTDPDGDSLLHIRDPHARRDPRDKFTPAQIVAALETAGGVYLGAARLLRCSHTTIAAYVRRYDDIRAAKAELDEELLDRAEAGLYQRMIDSSDPVVHLRACMFVLATRGAARGYGRVAPAPVTIQATYVPSPAGTTVLDPSRLSNDELRTLIALLAKASKPRADASLSAA